MANFTAFVGLDPRVDSWVTMGNPIPVTIITFAYIIFVTWLGPKIMKSRKPLDVKPILIVYNALQVLWCSYLLIYPFRRYDLLRAFFMCHPSTVDSNSPWWYDTAYVAWCYYISKMIDLLDTVFFVLRKKHKQISRLHLYHHGAILPSVWVFLKYQLVSFVPLIVLNVGVHVIMYTYYLIAALGPSFAKYIWWKKYMTALQLGQFVAVIIYLSILWSHGCISRGLAIYIVLNNFILIALFGNFYIESYSKKPQKQF